MRAQISRTLVIKSPIELYKILNNKDELKSNNSLDSFVDIVERYLNGCRCLTDMSFYIMNEEYDLISNNSDVIDSIKSVINCDNVIFQNNLI